MWNIIQEHLYLDVYEGIARNKKQIAATAGGMVGEANRQANRCVVWKEMKTCIKPIVKQIFVIVLHELYLMLFNFITTTA